MKEIDKFIKDRKWGSLTLNFRNGKIENINRVDSVRVSVNKETIRVTNKVSTDPKPA